MVMSVGFDSLKFFCNFCVLAFGDRSRHESLKDLTNRQILKLFVPNAPESCFQQMRPLLAQFNIIFITNIFNLLSDFNLILFSYRWWQEQVTLKYSVSVAISDPGLVRLTTMCYMVHIWRSVRLLVYFIWVEEGKIQSKIRSTQCHLFGFFTVLSAKSDNIFWNKFEETLFRWLIWTTFLQIFSHPHFMFSENVWFVSSAQV
jgi:hypothetical protein